VIGNLVCSECVERHQGHPGCIGLVILHNLDHDRWQYRYRCPRTGLIQVWDIVIQDAHHLHQNGVPVRHWTSPRLSPRPACWTPPRDLDLWVSDQEIRQLCEQGG
jgi:hypothetical protein